MNGYWCDFRIATWFVANWISYPSTHYPSRMQQHAQRSFVLHSHIDISFSFFNPFTTSNTTFRLNIYTTGPKMRGTAVLIFHEIDGDDLCRDLVGGCSRIATIWRRQESWYGMIRGKRVDGKSRRALRENRVLYWRATMKWLRLWINGGDWEMKDSLVIKVWYNGWTLPNSGALDSMTPEINSKHTKISSVIEYINSVHFNSRNPCIYRTNKNPDPAKTPL